MKKHLFLWKMLVFIGLVFHGSYSSATTCPNAINIPSIPVTAQPLVCGAGNDLSATTVPAACGGASNSYKGGNEALYTYTPAATGVHNISISGVTWTSIFVYQGCPTSGGICVGSIGNSSTTKTLSPTLTAGLQYFIWFDTWPAPSSPCPGTFSITGPAPSIPCSGTPNAGTATISTSIGCPSVNFNLGSTGVSTGTGITYQWQSSPTGAAPWTNIPSATNPTLTTSTASTLSYRLRTFCSNSSQENFTNIVTYTVSGGICGCGLYPAIFASNALDTEISSVTVGSMTNNPNNCLSAAPGAGSIAGRYSNFTGTVSGPSAILGSSVNFSLTQTSCGGNFNNGFQIFVDWNQDSDFLDADEFVYAQPTSINGTHTVTGSFTVPAGALLGSTRMRIVVAENYVNTTNFAHTAYTYGETEDYCFTVLTAPDCAGTPNAGTATISASTGCFGVNFNLSATGISAGTGITYQWQSSPTGAAPWTDVSGATNVTFTTNTATTLSYRLRTTCSFSAQENFSSIVTYTAQDCYLVPFTGNNSVTTCSGTLYDHNGATGDYAINANGFTVINPGTPGFLVQVSGTTAGEGCCDFLRIYDGVGIGGTLLWQGVAGAGAVPLQTSSTGALTVQFTSDFSINGAGFALNIACEAPCFGPAEPGFGANSWNITAYNGRDINLGGSTVLRGFYTESALSYNTQTAWGPLLSPSSVAGYTGCPVNVENHTVVSKRQGVPTNGVYQIDVTNHDDEYILLVNGVKAFENTYANISHQGVSVGYFDGSTNFEMRHADGGGESKHALTFTLQNLNANVATLDPTSCAPSNGQITFSNPSGAVASPVFRSSFDDNSGLTMAGSANVSGGVLNLTPAVNSSYGTAVLTNQTNMNASVFRAEFDFRVFDGGGADGFSFNYAPSYPASPVYDVYEQGWGGGLSVSFITFSGAGGPFVRVSYNGVAVSGNVFASIRNANYRQCVVSVNASNQITVSIDGVNVITNLALPSAFQTTDKTNWQYAFASRTGGVNDAHRIDNVVINAFNQYEYSVDGATWSSNPQFTGIAGGTYTPQIRNRAFPAYPTTLPAVTLNNPTASGVSVVSAPAPYTWIDGNTYTSNNNTATFNIVGGAANGCDSLVTLNLTIIPNPNAPDNDVPCGAFNITPSGQTALNTFGFLADMSCNNNSGNNTDANFDAIGSACNGVFGRSLWYTFTTPLCAVNDAVPFEIELSTNNPGTNFNTKVYLFAAQNNNGCSDLIQLACNDDHNGAGYPALCGPGGASASTIVATNLLPNTQYWVKVDGLNVSDAGNFVLSGRAVAPAHTTTVTGGGTQLQVTTQNMGAGLYTYYYKQVGSTGHSTFNTPSALTDVRTLSPGFSYQTQMMYRCGSNAQQSQFYRTAPQTIALASTCAVVTDMTCTSNGNGTYTLTWTQPNGILFTNNGQLSGYILKRQVQNQAGIFTVSNPQPVCANGSCSLTVTGLTNPAGYNFWLETRCSANTTQQGNLSSCSPQAPNFGLNNDGDNNINRTVQNTFSFVNAQEGIEFIDVQMHDAYGNFGLDVPMLGDYEIFVNDNNEISWRRVDTPVDANFDFVIVPNPSNTMTTVHLNTVVEAGTFTIVDAMGRTINSGAIGNTDNVNIDAAQLQSGVYMVVVTVGNQQMTRRLVVAN